MVLWIIDCTYEWSVMFVRQIKFYQYEISNVLSR